ncbi:alpha/beta fold hydrolase [Lactiplantibacillus plantarum]
MKSQQTTSGISYFSLGNGTPIIFLHGLALNKQSTYVLFDPLLKASKYQRIYLDLPGMGQSASTSSSTSDDVLEIIIQAIQEIIGNKQFILYGHSYGGYLALGIASRLKSKILGAFLTCPVVTAIDSARQRGKHINIFKEEVLPSKNKEYFTDFLNMNVVIGPRTWKSYQELIIPGLQTEDQLFVKNLKRHYKLTFEESIKKTNYPFPITIMVGRNDQVVGYEEQLQFIAHNSNGAIILLNQTGHNLIIDQREAVNFHLPMFLEGLAENR